MDKNIVLSDNSVIAEDVIALLNKEYIRATQLHPDFSTSKEMGVVIIAEELGEMSKAIMEGTNDIEEAAHVAVTAIRYIAQYLDNK